MSVLILPDRQVAQPNRLIYVDESNWLANGLVGFWYPVGIDLMSAIPGVANFTRVGVTGILPYSRGTLRGNAVGSFGRTFSLANALQPKPTAAITVLFEGRTTSSTSTDYTYGCENGGGSAGFGCYETTIASTRPYMRIGAAWADQQALNSVGASAQVGQTFDGTTYWAIANGVRAASQAISGTITYDASTGLAISAASDGVSGNTTIGDSAIQYFAIWNRALTVTELAAFYANPWQILKGRPRRLYVLASTAFAMQAAMNAIANAISTATTGIKLAASPNAIAASNPPLSTGIPLIAPNRANASTSSTITTGIALAAMPGAVSNTSFALTTAIRFAVAPNAVAGFVGTLFSGSFVASMGANASLGGTLGTAVPLAAGLNSIGSATSAMLSGVPLLVSIAAKATPAATLSTGISLGATPYGVSNVTAAFAPSASALAAALGSSASLGATLLTGIPLGASPFGVSNVSATLASNAAAFASALAAAAAFGGTLSTGIPLAAQLPAEATPGIALSTGILLGSQQNALSQFAGTFSAPQANFAAALSAKSMLGASLSSGISLAMSARAVATVAVSALGGTTTGLFAVYDRTVAVISPDTARRQNVPQSPGRIVTVLGPGRTVH